MDTKSITGGMMKLRAVKVPLEDEQLESILKYVTPERRAEILLDEVDRISESAYDRYTASMSAKNAQAFLLAPMFIGGDSGDITTFVEEVWKKAVTDENYKEVAQEFREWYKRIAPDEYHDPKPTQLLINMGYK